MYHSNGRVHIAAIIPRYNLQYLAISLVTQKI